MKHQLKLLTWHISIIVAVVPFGAMFTSAFSGYLSDIFGRKKLLFFSSVCFIIGTILCYLSKTFVVLLIGRIIIGIAIESPS